MLALWRAALKFAKFMVPAHCTEVVAFRAEQVVSRRDAASPLCIQHARETEALTCDARKNLRISILSKFCLTHCVSRCTLPYAALLISFI